MPEASFALRRASRSVRRPGADAPRRHPEGRQAKRRERRGSAVSPTRWARSRASGPRALAVPEDAEVDLGSRLDPAPSGAARSRGSPRAPASFSTPARITPVDQPVRGDLTAASRRLAAPLPPRESDRPRAELVRHPRHRRRITGAGFAPPHRLRRSRLSVPPKRAFQPGAFRHLYVRSRSPFRTPHQRTGVDSASVTSGPDVDRDGRRRAPRLGREGTPSCRSASAASAT